MADVILKVKVLQGYKDAETKETRSIDEVLDMTPDRYAEAVASLARWPGKFLEVVSATGADMLPPEEPPQEAQGPKIKELPQAPPVVVPEPTPAEEKESAKGKAKK